MENTNKEKKYLRAKERLEEVKKFYTSIFSGLFVILMVAGLNYYINQWSYPWFLWVVFAWFVGLLFKAIKVFGFNSFFGKDWEERKIKEFMKDDENQKRWK
jgi:hypothetical protein